MLAISEINVDMDGVLCDFIGRAREVKPDLLEWGEDEILWPVVLGIDRFWEDLPWLKGGRELMQDVMHYATKWDIPVRILTSPTKWDARVYPGKLEWLKLNNIKLPVIFEKEKYIHAKPGSLLIDDLEKNITAWAAHGGTYIHHKDINTTLHKLHQMFPLNHEDMSLMISEWDGECCYDNMCSVIRSHHLMEQLLQRKK